MKLKAWSYKDKQARRPLDNVLLLWINFHQELSSSVEWANNSNTWITFILIAIDPVISQQVAHGGPRRGSSLCLGLPQWSANTILMESCSRELSIGIPYPNQRELASPPDLQKTKRRSMDRIFSYINFFFFNYLFFLHLWHLNLLDLIEIQWKMMSAVQC